MVDRSTEEGWIVGERVGVNWEDGNYYEGQVVRLKTRVAVVRFDDGTTFDVDLSSLIRVASQSGGDEDQGEIVKESDGDIQFNPPQHGKRGMHHYPISWSADGTHFNLWAAPDKDDISISSSGDALYDRIQGCREKAVHFYGWWRKTFLYERTESGKLLHDKKPGYSVDIYARITDNDGTVTEYCVETIPYVNEVDSEDPRTNMHMLNSDICAAVRKWFFFQVRGDRRTVIDLQKSANSPTIKVPSLNWLDRVIMKMQEVRDTALRSGGLRYIVLDTGLPGQPAINLEIDFTSLAVAFAENNEGKIPSVLEGAMYEQAIQTGGKQPIRLNTEDYAPDSENVQALRERLLQLNNQAKQGGEGAAAAKNEARKIRGVLREMGIRGGARSVS